MRDSAPSITNYQLPITHVKRSFTLVELLVVIGIIWALAGVSAPFLSTFLGSKQLATTTDKIVRTLRKAQNYTLSGKEDDVWGVHYESGLLVLFKGSTYPPGGTSFDEKFNLPRTVEINGWADVYFQKLRGKPSQTPTITIKLLNEQQMVVVNSEGMVNVQ